jgi:hypothetical protein
MSGPKIYTRNPKGALMTPITTRTPESGPISFTKQLAGAENTDTRKVVAIKGHAPMRTKIPNTNVTKMCEKLKAKAAILGRSVTIIIRASRPNVPKHQ